jgi:hypothetical protein
MSARFTLDETRARKWLRDAVEAYPDGMRGGTCNPDTGEELPEIGAGWKPRDYGEDYNVDAVVRIASEADIIGRPDGMELYFDYTADDDRRDYQFLVYVGPHLKLASPCMEMHRIGTPDTEGIAAAMDILREAVQSANGVLEALDEYVSARR